MANYCENDNLPQRINTFSKYCLLLQDLTERRYKNEASIRDLKSKLTSVEEENILVKQDVQALRKQNTSLGNFYTSNLYLMARFCCLHFYQFIHDCITCSGLNFQNNKFQILSKLEAMRVVLMMIVPKSSQWLWKDTVWSTGNGKSRNHEEVNWMVQCTLNSFVKNFKCNTIIESKLKIFDRIENNVGKVGSTIF